jgi:hypothetical protein
MEEDSMKRLSVVSVITLGAVSLFTASAALADAPATHSNADPYRVNKPAAATGRAGNATLAARALMNKDGTTDVDITTGKLDSTAVAPGNISKVQIKTFNGDAEVQWTKNYSSLTSGGTLHYNFPELHRGQSIQTQANIEKIDKRTGVVTLTNTVKLRPDLAVKGIDAPSKVQVGSSVVVSAMISEANGDVGARGDCKLFVDGNQVDQALGIWIDGADSVTCAFNYQFTTVGTHSLKVTVDNVVPSDWDSANNSASGTIEVFDNTSAPLWGSASLWAGKGTYAGTTSIYYLRADGTFPSDPDYLSKYNDTIDQQSYWLWAGSNTGFVFPLTSAKVAIKSDDVAVGSTTFSNTWGYSYDDGGSYSYGCTWGDDAVAASFGVCSNSWNGYGWTDMWTSRWGGVVTYHSEGYDRRQGYWWGGYNYQWNYDGAYSAPSFAVGDKFEISYELVDSAGTRFAPSPVINTSPWSDVRQQPEYCNNYYWNWNERYCYSYDINRTGKQGWTWFQSP